MFYIYTVLRELLKCGRCNDFLHIGEACLNIIMIILIC